MSWPPEGPVPPGFPRREPPSRAAEALAPVRFTPYDTERLFQLRLVMLSGRIDGERATETASRLMTLDALGDEPVTLHLRCEDADLDAAFSLIDTIDVLRCRVHALAVGEVGGPALGVLASAGRREMTRHAVLRLAEPRQTFGGTAAELTTREREHRRLTEALYRRLADTTGRTPEEIERDARKGLMLTGPDALAYGLVHDVAGTAPPGLSG